MDREAEGVKQGHDVCVCKILFSLVSVDAFEGSTLAADLQGSQDTQPRSLFLINRRVRFSLHPYRTGVQR